MKRKPLPERQGPAITIPEGIERPQIEYQSQPDTIQRYAELGAYSLAFAAVLCGQEDEEPQTNLKDLLTDLLHAARYIDGLDFFAALDAAKKDYYLEIRLDAAQTSGKDMEIEDL